MGATIREEQEGDEGKGERGEGTSQARHQASACGTAKRKYAHLRSGGRKKEYAGGPQTPLLTTLPLVGVPQGGPQTRSPTPYPPAGDPQGGPQSRYPYDGGAGATARPPHANPRAAAQHQRRAVSTPSLGLVGGSDAR